MKKQTIHLALSLFLATSSLLQAQTTEKPWRAVKIGVNYVATLNSDLPKMLLNHQQPFGIFNPVFQWGKTNRRWNEVSIPFLVLNHNQQVTYESFQHPGLEAAVKGNLKAHYETGIGIERSWLTGRKFLNIPLAYGVGAFFMNGRYTFNSNVPGVLDFKCRTLGFRPYVSVKLIKTYKHLFFDFQSQLSIQGIRLAYEYALIGNQVPANTRRNDSTFNYALGLRVGVGYRW
ncbi:MAG: hypothetical protein KGS48_08620 [Bacteroidetes bacterium]|nr:hypothetical protein [Bacteroidota bacterium]